VTSRTYLSIGDVLTLLREEFPDVTISKIRFLESQGLVNPERSPSGYRKFFEHDVERLRWVLRQQREHFLPLKVIRDRLADGDLDDDAAAQRPNGKEAQPAHVAAVAGVAASHTQEQPTKADEEAMARILADASRRAARLPDESQARRGLQVVAGAEGAPRGTAEVAKERDVPPIESTRRSGVERRGGTAATAGGRAGASPQTSTSTSSGGSGRGNGTGLPHQPDASATPKIIPAPADAPARKGPGQAGDAAPPSAPGTAATMVTGASLSADELCAASGLSPEEVAGLKGFGLVECVTVAGIETYD
jgi:DNA-binding transcriptional MerR regulator